MRMPAKSVFALLGHCARSFENICWPSGSIFVSCSSHDCLIPVNFIPGMVRREESRVRALCHFARTGVPSLQLFFSFPRPLVRTYGSELGLGMNQDEQGVSAISGCRSVDG